MFFTLKKAGYSIIALSFFLFSSFHSPHAIYLSMVEVDFQSDKSIITIKVFSDDLQNALKNHTTGYLSGPPLSFFGKNTGIAEDYFSKHLMIRQHTAHALRYISHSVENDAHFIVFHSEKLNVQRAIEVKADFFMELFPTQSNVIKFNHSEPQYMRFTLGDEWKSISLR